MFTGLVESVGQIAEVAPITGGYQLRIGTALGSEVSVGESIAINGVCLTVRAATADSIQAQMGPETARVTTLGRLKPGAAVNLERALRADGRFGGHLVSGHVDGTGTIEGLLPEADFWWMTVSYPTPLEAYLIHRGSIAVDGISLTVAALERGGFRVQIVPYTWSHTNLDRASVSDLVNLECDMVGKYVVRTTELMGLGIGHSR